MQDIQQVFHRLQGAKKKKKDLETAYKDALKTSGEYTEVSDKLGALRERKKQIELTIRQQFAGELTQLGDLKIDMASDVELLTDLAMNQFMKGESVEIVDEHGVKYEPVFKVSFKKTV